MKDGIRLDTVFLLLIRDALTRSIMLAQLLACLRLIRQLQVTTYGTFAHGHFRWLVHSKAGSLKQYMPHLDIDAMIFSSVLRAS